MSRTNVSVPAEAHELKIQWAPNEDGWGSGVSVTITCNGDGERPCPFESCPFAPIVGQGLQRGFEVGWDAGWRAAAAVSPSKVAPAATSPVSVTFGPGSIAITLPEREVHIDAPITVQMPEHPRETLEVVRDKDGKMSRIRPLEVS